MNTFIRGLFAVGLVIVSACYLLARNRLLLLDSRIIGQSSFDGNYEKLPGKRRPFFGWSALTLGASRTYRAGRFRRAIILIKHCRRIAKALHYAT